MVTAKTPRCRTPSCSRSRDRDVDDRRCAGAPSFLYASDGSDRGVVDDEPDRELAIDDNLAYVRRRRAVSATAATRVPRILARRGHGVSRRRPLGRDRTHRPWRRHSAGGRSSSPTLPPVLIGRGTREEWYTEAKLQNDLRFLRRDHGRDLRLRRRPRVDARFREAAGDFWADSRPDLRSAGVSPAADGRPRPSVMGGRPMIRQGDISLPAPQRRGEDASPPRTRRPHSSGSSPPR